MKKPLVFGVALVFVFGLIAATCDQPPSAVTGGAKWTQVFDDEFNGTSVDQSQWNVQNGSNFGSSNNEQECYMAANTTESGGSLNLAARSGGASCSGYSVSSGMVTQRNQGGPQRFSYTHGYAEARIRIQPFGMAAWPAFWLVGAQGSPGWPAYGEVDVMEAYGPHSPFAETAYHDTGGNHANAIVNMGDLSAWHTYAVNWTASQITWYYDGNAVSTYATVNNIAHSVILDYAIGGDGPGFYGYNGNPSTSLPSTMQVDYVRIWQK